MRGDRLRRHREEQGYTQEELSEMLGIGVTQVWRYENEKSEPTSGILSKLVKALDVSADYLLGLTDEPKGFIDVEVTPQERRALEAFRRGDIKAIIRLLPDDEPTESSNK